MELGEKLTDDLKNKKYKLSLLLSHIQGWDGMGREEGGRRRVQDGETRVYLWRIHVDIWRNQYNIVKLKNKINKLSKH